ncbi:hypothetical protein HaLaN_11845 [Haematococcus lacustris]|uniref:Uncharacterized protein n=1 Tax=Haematococcus lacustris TaxID=44745 RepID=A0A699YZ67_HAELA|nr:hypothetical protein HaLaN_11845 [Haematococcus lacustris]
MRVATGEVDWWPEAFPCRAAFAAVGVATRECIKGKHGALCLNACCIRCQHMQPNLLTCTGAWLFRGSAPNPHQPKALPSSSAARQSDLETSALEVRCHRHTTTLISIVQQPGMSPMLDCVLFVDSRVQPRIGMGL